MRTNSTKLRTFLLALFLCCIGKFSNGQSFNCYITNDNAVSNTVYEFEVYISNTSGTDFSFRTAQHCITFNPSFINGAAVTVTFEGTTQMTNYTPGGITWSVAANGFQVASNTGVACANGTIIPGNGTPRRIGKFKLTATSGSFGCAPSNPNMVQTGDPSPSGLALRMAITKWDSNTCTVLTTTTITNSGQYTKLASQNLYSNLNNNLPTITSQPVSSVTACSGGGNVSFSVAATANGLSNSIGYQWFENGLPLSDGVGANATYLGSNAATLNISAPSVNIDGYVYTCQVIRCGNTDLSRTSSQVTIHVNNTDDGDLCTTDACNPVTNAITHTAVNTNDNDGCTIDGCVPATGVFHNQVNIDDNSACTIDGCEPSTGVISHTANWSQDGDLCTTESCDPATGSVSSAVNWSQDGNLCDVESCTPATGLITHTANWGQDADLCTNESCDPATGNVSSAVNWNQDNNLCDIESCDPLSGVISHAINWTQDANLCDVESCIPATGNLTHTPNWGQDADFCTTESCDPATGLVSSAINWSQDANLCDVESCAPATGIVDHTPNWGQDADLCTNESCDPATGSVSSAVNWSQDNNLCDVESCTPVTGIISHTANWGQDADLCTTESCAPATGFVSSAVNWSQDADKCDDESCDPLTGTISHAINWTQDVNLCDVEACVPATGSLTHTPNWGQDVDLCTTESCDPATGSVSSTVNWTQDADLCTIESCTPATGVISHTANWGQDADLCTIESCNPVTGAVSSAVNWTQDANLCDVESCTPATGAISHTLNWGPDANLCTNESCTPATGVVNHTINWSPDANLCDIESCDIATGAIAHTPVNIDDNNVCTTDACAPVSGAITHTAININDNDVCTTDACDPITGVSHTAVNIDDNNACTTDACNPVSGISHTPVNISDNVPCTSDACDPATGTITHINNPPAPAVSTGNIFCNGGTTSITISATSGTAPYTGTGVFSPYGAGNYIFTVTDSKGCAVDANVTITEPVKLIVTVTTVASECANLTGSVTANPTGGTPGYTYLWSAGVTTQARTGLGAGTYTVTVTDIRNCTATASGTVTVSGGGYPAAPGAINGPAGVCRDQCNTFSIAPVPNATSYIWTLPTGTSGSSTGTSITVCASSQLSTGLICVRAVNSCGQGPSTCKTIKRYTTSPNTPASITGSTNICRGSCNTTYSIAAVANTTSYVWSVTGGLTISSGQGSTSIVVCAPSNANNNAQIRVYAKNCRGNSSTRSKNINAISVPSQPGTISGTSPVCKSYTNRQFSVSSVSNATSYTWTVTNGVTISSGQGSRFVYLSFPSSTSTSTVLSVKANNSCGSSTVRTRTITINNCRLSNSPLSDESEVTLSSLTAYPNPTTGKTMVTFNSDRSTKYTLKVVDIIGKVLLSESAAAIEGVNMKEISLENASQGLYFISINVEGTEVQTLKLIVE